MTFKHFKNYKWFWNWTRSSVSVHTTEGWGIVNNIFTHQGANPQNLTLDPPSTKCITVRDFNSRPVEPKDMAMVSKVYSLIQSNPNNTLVNTPRVPITLSETTLTISLTSPDIAPVTDWEVHLAWSCKQHFASLTTLKLSPRSHIVPFTLPRFIQEKAEWDLFQ